MFITAVCFIFLIKLRWPKTKSLFVSSAYQNPVRFHFTLFKLPDPGANIYVQRLLKFSTWSEQGRSKSPSHPVVPPSGITLGNLSTDDGDAMDDA